MLQSFFVFCCEKKQMIIVFYFFKFYLTSIGLRGPQIHGEDHHIVPSSGRQKHRNTKYIHPKLRNICSKLRNNHENSNILRKNNQKSCKFNKILINNQIDENKIFQKTRKNMFYAFLFCHLESMLEQPNHFPDEQN